MPSALSTRERRYFFAALAVAILILGSSFFAPKVSAWLRAEELLAIAFSTAFVLTLIALVAMARDAKLGKADLGLIVGILAVFVFAAVRMNLPEERSHLIEYAILSALLFEALRPQEDESGLLRAAFAAAILASLIGLLDELIQIAVPGRVFDIRDVSFNIGAAVGGVAILFVVARSRFRFE